MKAALYRVSPALYSAGFGASSKRSVAEGLYIDGNRQQISGFQKTGTSDCLNILRVAFGRVPIKIINSHQRNAAVIPMAAKGNKRTVRLPGVFGDRGFGCLNLLGHHSEYLDI